MKLGIVWRTGIAMALIGVLASGLTGYYAFTESRALLQSAAEQRLLTATRVLARQLSVGLDNASRDVLMVAQHPGTLGLLQTWESQAPNSRGSTMAALFDTILRTHPEYFQMRLIAATDHGAERVRVDRSEEGLARIFEEDLQEKGHYPYVVETLRLPQGAVYVSRASINHEMGAHAGHHTPSLQVATPVYDAQQQALGLIVVNIDLERLFNQLRNNLPSHYRLFLANAEGDFLLHPDPQQAFAFERGQRSLLQAQFPALAGLLDEDSAPRVADLGRQASAEHLVGAFSRVSLDSDQGTRVLILGLAVEHSHVVAGANRLAGQMLQLGLLLSLLAALLALWLGRAFSAPLRAMVKEIQHFSEHRQIGTLPLQREDELGLLARSIHQQQSQILEQIQQLHDSHQAAEHLAHHDPLTGLGNRLLFIDRLQHAISNARRSGKRLALVFVDLDYFKEINDSHGHAMGDAVLRQVANLLRGATRAGDTVARLGGDEFVILYDGLDTHSDLPQIAGKLLARFQNRLLIDGQEIHIQASMGISRFPEDGQDSVSLLQHADRAMYQAKRDGRNRIRFSNEHG